MSRSGKQSSQILSYFSQAHKTDPVAIEPGSKKDTRYLLALFFSAAFLLLFCSRNSPAFVYQHWVDPNIYMNVSRAIKSGSVMYRDIFDHKGPLLYLVLALFSALPVFSFSMTGMFLLQCVTLSVSLNYLYRTARLFLNPVPSFGIGYGFLFFLFNNLTYGQGGGSIEELLLPVFLGALYELVRFYYIPLASDIGKPKPAFFRLGLLIGIATFVKINLALAPAVITVFLLVPFFTKRDFSGLWRSILRIAAGGFSAAAPCFIYFILTNSFSDFWNSYIDFNIHYAKPSGNTMEAATFSNTTGTILFLNAASVLCIALGALCSLLNRKRIQLIGQVGLGVGFVVLFATVFATSRPNLYFFIPFLGFAGLSEIVIVLTIQQFFSRRSKNNAPALSRSILRISISIAVVLLIAFANGAWSETRWFRNEKSGVEVISEEILTTWNSGHKDTSPSILLFNSGDFGYYQLTKTIPSLRFFYAPIINPLEYPYVTNSQLGYIRDGLPDYIIVNLTVDDFTYDFSKINPAYVMIDEQVQKFGTSASYIYLYEKQPVE